MNRRQALSSVAVLLGGSIVGGEVFAFSNKVFSSEHIDALFSKKDVELMDEIAETIIPETNTPGAKAAKTGMFMAIMVKDCYTPGNQKVFIDGLAKVNKLSIEKWSANFIDCTPSNRTELLTQLDIEQRNYQKKKKSSEPVHYFRMMRELTLLGYFTSEIGATQQLEYVEVPGRFDACVDFKKGDKQYLNP